MGKIRVATCANCGREIEFQGTETEIDYDMYDIPREYEMEIWKHRETDGLICIGSGGATGAYPDQSTIHEMFSPCEACGGAGMIRNEPEYGGDCECGICQGTGENRN